MKILVVGCNGFLGQAIVKQLIERGDQVYGFCRGTYPMKVKDNISIQHGDIRDYVAIDKACQGMDAVIHTASKAGIWGPYQEYYSINVTGTNNILRACKNNHVKYCIYTSTPSVIFNGDDIEGADESLPYANKFLTAYPKTKAIAERHVLTANCNELHTLALRPHLIWGPGDHHLIPRLITKAKLGKLALLDQGNKKVDSIYIDNAANAHLKALASLANGNSTGGKAYFITQDQPMATNDLINAILKAAQLPPVSRIVPAKLAYIVGYGLEIIYKLCRIRQEPRITRFVAKQLSTAHWFDISAAKRDLNYTVNISIDEGLQRLQQWFEQQNRDNDES